MKEKTMTQQWIRPSHSACVKKKQKTKNNNYNTNRKKHPTVHCRQHEHFYQTCYKENFHLETIGQFNVNGLFLSGRCWYVSILHCFYRDGPNATRQASAGVCLPLSSFYYRWDRLRLSWAVLTTSGTATATTRIPTAASTITGQ